MDPQFIGIRPIDCLLSLLKKLLTISVTTQKFCKKHILEKSVWKKTRKKPDAKKPGKSQLLHCVKEKSNNFCQKVVRLECESQPESQKIDFYLINLQKYPNFLQK